MYAVDIQIITEAGSVAEAVWQAMQTLLENGRGDQVKSLMVSSRELRSEG